MADLTLVEGETVTVRIQIADRNGPIPLGTFSAVHYDILDHGSAIQSCTGSMEADGWCEFTFDATDTGTPGQFTGHVRAVRGDSTTLHFPSERRHTVHIRQSTVPS